MTYRSNTMDDQLYLYGVQGILSASATELRRARAGQAGFSWEGLYNAAAQRCKAPAKGPEACGELLAWRLVRQALDLSLQTRNAELAALRAIERAAQAWGCACEPGVKPRDPRQPAPKAKGRARRAR